MSYEGYSQFWCKKGHYWTKDCNELTFKEEKEKCPICNKEEVFKNNVNITNGSFDEDDNRIDGFIEPELKSKRLMKCDCGRTRVCECSTYKIPKEKE